MIRIPLLPLSTIAIAATLAAQVPTPPLTPPSRTIGSMAPNGPGGVYPIGIAQGAWNPTTPLVIATADSGSNRATVYAANTAAATLTRIASATTAAGSNPKAVTVADLNQDGIAELIVSCNGSGPGGGSAVPASIEVHRQSGSSALSRTLTITGGLSTLLYGSCQAVGDVTGDGLPDLVVASPSTAAVIVFQNRTVAGGAITFAAPVGVPLAIAPNAIALVDLNLDGTLDIAAAGLGIPGGVAGVQTMIAIPGNAAAFGIPSGVAPTTNGAYDIVAGDFNGDGATELATASLTNIDHFLVIGGAPFFVQAMPVQGFAFSLATSDVDGDGRLDLATVASPSCNVTVLRNTGTTPGCPGFPLIACPVFVSEPLGASAFAGTSTSSDITIADLDANGSPDFVVTASALNMPTALLTDTAIAAYSASLGGASPTGFTLSITNPVIVPAGVALFGTLAGPVVGQPWVFYGSANSGPAAGVPLFGGTVFVDTLTMLPLASGVVSPAGTFPIGVLPNVTSLIGLQNVGQVALVPPSGIGFDLTNAVLMRIGT